MHDTEKADLIRAVGAIIQQEVTKAVAQAIGPLLEQIAILEARKPEKGDKGDQGEVGPAGPAGVQGPAGLDGKDGAVGMDGKDGAPGPQGPAGPEGKAGPTGTGLAQLTIDRNGHLIGTLSNGQGCDVGPVVGRDGKDGVDGKDGAPGPVLVPKVTYDGIRTFTINDEAFKVPVMLHAGVWKDSGDYEQGDTVTHRGSIWHCDLDGTKDIPGTPGSGWTLCAKHGQNGKDGKDGGQGPKGDKGDPGRDGKDLTIPVGAYTRLGNGRAV